VIKVNHRQTCRNSQARIICTVPHTVLEAAAMLYHAAAQAPLAACGTLLQACAARLHYQCSASHSTASITVFDTATTALFRNWCNRRFPHAVHVHYPSELQLHPNTPVIAALADNLPTNTPTKLLSPLYKLNGPHQLCTNVHSNSSCLSAVLCPIFPAYLVAGRHW
jgi:hypothetical protein